MGIDANIYQTKEAELDRKLTTKKHTHIRTHTLAFSPFSWQNQFSLLTLINRELYFYVKIFDSSSYLRNTFWPALLRAGQGEVLVNVFIAGK